MNPEVNINPKMLMLARQTRGLSQRDLAELVGISASMLSKIENSIDFYPVEDKLIHEFSEVLKFDKAFFQRNPKDTNVVASYFRRNKTVSKRKVDQILGTITIYSFMIDEYLRLVETPDVNLIEWDVELQGTPEHAASNLREFWKIPKGRIVNLSKILENNGIFVIEIDFENDKIDGYSTWSPIYRNPIIFVNSKYSEDRKRLTIAHELGHLIIHTNRFTISQYRDVEKEAFAFASEFMAPLKEFKSQLGNDKITFQKLGSLKQYWMLSMHFFVYKSQSYKLVTSNQARYLYQQLAPYRKKEPLNFQLLKNPAF